MADLTDQQIRNQVFIEGLKAGEHKRFEKYLRQIDRLVRDRLLDEGEVIQNKANLNALLRDIESGQMDIYAEYNSDLIDMLEGLTLDQAEFGSASVNVLFGDITQPASNAVALAAFRNEPMQIQDYSGKPLVAPFVRDLTDNQVGMIQTKIRQGFSQGRTTAQIARDIRGTKAQNYKNGELARVNRSNSALVRTVIQHASTQGKMATYKSNEDVLTGYEWVSTLDSRTTVQCRSLDGNVYKFGKGPLPPIHIGCRSVTVPVVDKRYNLLADSSGTRGSKGADGSKPVSSDQTYYSWLKGQPVAFQNSTIGPNRAKLLRDGGLSSEEFASLQLDKSFQPLTLGEMRAKRPEVFERAGL